MRPAAAADLGEDGLEPFLELAPVLGPGDQGTHVEAEDRLVPQALGDITAGDPLGQALHDRGLAHAGIADQDRVVLGLPGQDLDDAPDLGVPADDRVEFAAGRLGDQVPAVLGQGLVGRFRHGGGDPLVAADRRQCLQESVLGHALGLEQAAGRGGRALGEQRHEQVLDRDVLVLEPARLLFGRVQQAVQPLRDPDLPRVHARAGDPGTPGELRFQRRAQPVGVRAGLGEQPGSDPLRLVEQRQQQVLAVHLGMPETERLRLRVVQRLLRFLRQAVRVHGHLPGRRAACPRRAASSTAIRSSRSVTSPMAG